MGALLYCDRFKYPENELNFLTPHKNDEQLKLNASRKIQRSWRKFESRKKTIKERLEETIHHLDTKSTQDNEFVSIDRMNMKTSNTVFGLERKLGKFIQTPEIHYFPFSKIRDPLKQFDGSIFYGYWNMDGLKHGYGVLVRSDGSKYEGFFENDKLSGRGRFIDGQGAFYYEGMWSNNKANGKGCYWMADGTKYIGDWKNDLQDGYGEETFTDGTIYRGQFAGGEKQGKGKVIWKDGSNFEGYFVTSSIHGYGEYKWADGRTYVGQWQNGKMHGKGKFTWPDGKYYEGEYKNDKKDGFGKYYWNNKCYEGTWMNGKQNGYGSIFYGNVLFLKGFWRFGKLIQKTYEKQADTLSQDKIETKEEQQKQDYRSERMFMKNETIINGFFKSKTINHHNSDELEFKKRNTYIMSKGPVLNTYTEQYNEFEM